MTLLLRPLARALSAIWVLVLALGALALAFYCLDGLIALGSLRPDRLLSLPTVRQHVGRFLSQVAAPGTTAGLALLCGLGAMAIGVALLFGIFRSPRERRVILDRGEDGTLDARPSALRDIARGLAARTRVAAAVDRPKLRLRRSGDGGRLVVGVARSRTTDEQQVRAELEQRLAAITEPFSLKPQVHVRVGERGERVA